jgi:hypothetical protein
VRPLPAKAKTALKQTRETNAQNPATRMRKIAAYWEVSHG